MSSYFKYKKHCQPLSLQFPVSPSYISSLPNHFKVKCCSLAASRMCSTPPLTARHSPPRWHNNCDNSSLAKSAGWSSDLYHTSDLFLPHRADENKNRGGRGRKGGRLREDFGRNVVWGSSQLRIEVCISCIKINTSPSLLLRLRPPLISPFPLRFELCELSLLNTAFCWPSQLTSVDQYEAMLGIHGLHHLTVQERALQLRQAQAIRLPWPRQRPGHSSSLSWSRWGQQGGVQRELILLWEKRLSGKPQNLLLTACRVAEAQATGRGFMR